MNIHHIISRIIFLLIPLLAGNLFGVKSFSVSHKVQSHSTSFARYHWQKQRSQLLVLQADEGDGEIDPTMGSEEMSSPPPPCPMVNAPPLSRRNDSTL
jgi:hypothetical protein